eukprot:TRINITY_DN17150_c0_g1_i9.p1 TRINITY_DN17150_c0_g1~~TRINITY_DN17150_c0_g1_i9.p1  ORF type:complete len:199 (-),score=65.37 TRINITY_DN17150_c0_g1_i9:108-704(-)
MIRRPPRSTLSSSSAASDVYKRQVSTQSTGSQQSTTMAGTARPLSDDLAGLIAPEYAANIESVLYTPEEIQSRCRELAAEISKDHAGEQVLVVGLLKGAFMVLADIARHLTVPNMVDFIAVSSYGDSQESSGSIKLKKDLAINPAGKHIIIIEDLIDTGGTLAWIQSFLGTKHPASVKLCCLLAKTCLLYTSPSPRDS